VPSMDPKERAKEDHKQYMKSMSWIRRFRAYWSVQGPGVLFIALIISMQIAFGTWQLVKYLTETQHRHVSKHFGFTVCPLTSSQAFGWGVVLAKSSAGIMYVLNSNSSSQLNCSPS
jgi:hypothetical protein